MSIYEFLFETHEHRYQLFFSSLIKCQREIENLIENNKSVLKYSNLILNKIDYGNKILVEEGEIYEIESNAVIYKVQIFKLIVR